MELTLSELQEMATRQQQQIEAQQQMLVAKVTPSFESLCVENVGFFFKVFYSSCSSYDAMSVIHHLLPKYINYSRANF